MNPEMQKRRQKRIQKPTEEQKKNLENYSKSLFEVQEDESLPEYGRFYKMFQDKYKQLYGKYYDTTDNGSQVCLVLKYFCKHKDAHSKGLDFNKGLCLLGSMGLGKTSILKTIKAIGIDFGINSTKAVVSKYEIEGPAAVQRFARYKDFCFDDLGAETKGKYYGKDEEVLQVLLEERYFRYSENKIKTHLSTNLSIEELEERYGARVYSRLNEMCNFIQFEGKDYRLI